MSFEDRVKQIANPELYFCAGCDASMFVEDIAFTSASGLKFCYRCSKDVEEDKSE